MGTFGSHTLAHVYWSWERKYWGQMCPMGVCLYKHYSLVIIYAITSVVLLLYSSDSRKCMSRIMYIDILHVPHRALYSNITKINNILADGRDWSGLRWSIIRTAEFIKIIQSHIIPYWIAFDDVFMILYIWMISLQRKCNVSSCVLLLPVKISPYC